MNLSENATVIVVHGAWADGSSWQAVVGPLDDRGLNVIAAPIPLTSLSDDAAALKRIIARPQDPLIVAGHAYAGAVIATANDERVKALVYVAAFAEQGIKDGVQVNSIVPGAVMTGRRRSFLEKWALAHNMSVEDATKKFPEEAEINRYGQPEEVAELLGFMVSPAAKWMTGTSVRMDGARNLAGPK